MAINDVECCDFYQVHEKVVEAVNKNMPDEDELYDLAELFKVFGDSTRIRVLYALLDRELCVGDLAQVVRHGETGSLQLQHRGGIRGRRGGGALSSDACVLPQVPFLPPRVSDRTLHRRALLPNTMLVSQSLFPCL